MVGNVTVEGRPVGSLVKSVYYFDRVFLVDIIDIDVVINEVIGVIEAIEVIEIEGAITRNCSKKEVCFDY